MCTSRAKIELDSRRVVRLVKVKLIAARFCGARRDVFAMQPDLK